MSAEATGWVWKHSPFRGVHGKFLCHLGVADVVNDTNGNEFWMAHSALADKVGVSRKTVVEFFAEAIELGLMECVEDNAASGRPNRYRMLFPTTSGHGGVSPEVTGGVTSGYRGVSPEVTGGVTSGDTKTKKNSKELTQKRKPPLIPPEGGGGGGDGDWHLFDVDPLVTSSSPRRRRSESEVTAICNAVLDAWCEAVGKDRTRVRLNAKRRRLISARLNERYEPDDLIAAVRGIAFSPWHMGDNPSRQRYDDLEVALRSGDRVERFRDLFERRGAPNGRRTDVVDRVFDRLTAGGVADVADVAELVLR